MTLKIACHTSPFRLKIACHTSTFRSKKWLLTALLLIVQYVAGWAQTVSQYNMTYLDLSTGLPNNNVNDIFVDSQGFVWISTYGGGAVRYDGYTFMSPSQSSEDIGSKACKGFAEDGFQRLWIAYDEGTQVLDMRTMSYVVPRYGDGHIGRTLKRDAVKVYCDAKGALWHVMRDSIYRYTFDREGRVRHISRCRYHSNTPDISICDIEQNGTVWIAIENGLFRLSEVGDRLERREIAPAMRQVQGTYVADLLKAGSTVWIATNNGLHAYDLFHSTLRSFYHTADPQSLPHDYVTSLVQTSKGTLLVGTLRGMCELHEHTGTFTRWTALPSDFIRCLMVYGSQLWIGTETAGVVKLSPKPLMLRDYVHRPQQPGSLSPHPVNAMYVEPNGTLWVGTVEGGLNRRSEHGDFTHWTTQESALSHNSVSVLTPDDAGHLWIGTWGGGVNVITLADPQRVTHVEMPADLVSQTNYIGSLAYDKYNNALWIGSNDGVFLYDLRTGRVEDPFPHNRDIRGCIGAHIDRSGQLWLGCLSGVCVVDLRSGRGKDGLFRGRLLRNKLDNPRSLVVDKITCFCETKNGTLWLGSNGYGLYRRIVDDDGREHFKALTDDDGLANNSVKGIVEDEQGRLWITTANGLSIYDCRSNTFINYGEREGLLCQRFYWNSAVKGPDGAIFLGSMDGVIEVRGENEEARHPVRLCFTRLLVDNQEVTATNSTMLDADISQATRIRLHESNKSLTISFSTLTYTGDVQGHYRYRMKGFEDEWTILKSDDHAVRYTSLKPGTYTFEVEYISDGQDAGDDISSLQPKGRSVASIRVDVAPYFWKSWWFVLLVVLLLAGMGVLFVRRRIEELRRKETEKLLIPIRKVMEESDDPERLQVSIQNILDTHEHLKKSYVRSVEADKQETLKSQKSFMERATKVMEQHYMDAGFGIEEFASAMGMSRSLVSKRLHAEAGVSTGQFIRNYRLTVAKKLILENMANRNITEIAYKVGFNDPKYFTRCFTHQYGHSPSTYAGEDESGVEKQENR